MQISHLTPENYTRSAWSGGVTTQLYIYPADGDYGQRRFSVRVSSASVELRESSFTPLPGVVRYITPLKGGFTLRHPGRPEVKMGPLDRPYRFMGDWETKCVGMASDFNLMLKGVEGSMEIAEGGARLKPGLSFIYPPDGGEVEVSGRRFDLAGGDMLVVRLKQGEEAAASFGRAILCRACV